MLEIIIKRDGVTEEPVIAKKVNNWMIWCAHDLRDRVNWSAIITAVIKNSPKKMGSQDFQMALVKECLSYNDWAHNLLAGRLYAVWHWKKFYPTGVPSIANLHQQLQDLGLMKPLDFTAEEYEKLERVIKHDTDLTYAQFQIKQVVYKYSVANRVEDIQYETPQFTFMRMAMALAERHDKTTRLLDTKAWYKYLSESKINAPTPNYNNLGTPHNGYASCCLYATGDSARSIGVGNHIAYTMTYMSAGIGGIMSVRSALDPVRNGVIEHQGKLPYYSLAGKETRANIQGGRGGAMNQYISIYDPEASEIAILQNPRTPADKQNRDMHFTFMYNTFFAKKVGAKEQIFTFNTFTAPDLYEAQFSGDGDAFEKLYVKYEQDESFKKNYVSAWDLCVLIESQGHEVSTVYGFDVQEANRHTSFKDPIRSSNLCVEITQPTSPYEIITDLYTEGHDRGEVSLCNLGGVNVAKFPLDRKYDEEYEDVCYYALKMADTTIDMADYELPHIGYTARMRRNAAIGALGVAEYFARRGIRFDTPHGMEVAHQLAERHMFFMIRASLRLGRELGNAPWIDRTKWPDGWLPIDTYKKNVDKITPHKLRYDWETLRAEVVANGGIRNSSLVAHMPTESSSKATGCPNGIYPIRGLSLKKTDLGNAIDWVAPDSDLFGDNYQIAYDVDTNWLIKYYAVWQKFTDQSMSPDFYEDRIKNPVLDENVLVERFLNRVRYGVKSKYYQNSLTPTESVTSDGTSSGTAAADQQEDTSVLINTEDRRANCSSGACTL